ncbi:MAG: photosynthetic complex putative assembly protein PuhB [Pseudomonadota bacterium]
MNLFHDEETGPEEPVAGLPQALPDGESILWQGSPSAIALAIHAFHIRFVALYFVVATAWRITSMASNGAAGADMAGVAATSLATCGAAIAILYAIAWAMARAAIFTITDARIVMRYGSAIRKYVNLPFAKITSADVRRYGDGAGDLAITSEGPGAIGYIHLWPFARPLKLARPQPTLRALPDIAGAANVLKSAMEIAIQEASDVTDKTSEPLEDAKGDASAPLASFGDVQPKPRYVRIPAQSGAA